MARKLTVTRSKEIRKGWSYRAFDFEVAVNDVLIGTVKDGQTVSFCVPEDEMLLGVWPRTVSRRPSWCAVIPAGRDDYRVTITPWLTTKDPIVEQIPAAPATAT